MSSESIEKKSYVKFVFTLTSTNVPIYQDIAVDGWALTMLSRENVGLASTCNAVGQTLGFFISQVGFLALYDASVCNKYFRCVIFGSRQLCRLSLGPWVRLRYISFLKILQSNHEHSLVLPCHLVPSCVRSEPSDVGMITLSTFLQFWGFVFLATTGFVCFFKAEVENGVNDKILGLVDTYKQVTDWPVDDARHGIQDDTLVWPSRHSSIVRGVISQEPSHLRRYNLVVSSTTFSVHESYIFQVTI